MRGTHLPLSQSTEDNTSQNPAEDEILLTTLPLCEKCGFTANNENDFILWRRRLVYMNDKESLVVDFLLLEFILLIAQHTHFFLF